MNNQLLCPVCHVIHAGWCSQRDMKEQMREAFAHIEPAPMNMDSLVRHGKVFHAKYESCPLCEKKAETKKARAEEP